MKRVFHGKGWFSWSATYLQSERSSERSRQNRIARSVSSGPRSPVRLARISAQLFGVRVREARETDEMEEDLRSLGYLE